MNDHTSPRCPRILPSLLAAALMIPGALRAGDDLTLRVEDGSAEAGSRFGLVVRTYAPRGVRQGQICVQSGSTNMLKLGAAAPAGPFATLEEVVVWSALGDAQSLGTFDPATQTAVIEFESLSSTINEADGPMAVLYFRLDDTLIPDQEFEVELDLSDSFLIDASGNEIPLATQSGTLRIREPEDPFRLEVEGDKLAPGDVAQLTVETSESVSIANGQVTLRFDPTIAGGAPTAVIDPRYGAAMWNIDSSQPGRIAVSLLSPDASLGGVSGAFLTISLPTSGAVEVGTKSPLSLDPVETFLEGPLGEPIYLVLRDDVIEFVQPENLRSGFIRSPFSDRRP